ncbi:MAG: hypothetical protein GDA50_07440 [Alphaproteobacteria bacterium GM202ARS2]|nr:hypothetical protein [Alphaproteobacteria bacterium GM202ARS2]
MRDWRDSVTPKRNEGCFFRRDKMATYEPEKVIPWPGRRRGVTPVKLIGCFCLPELMAFGHDGAAVILAVDDQRDAHVIYAEDVAGSLPGRLFELHDYIRKRDLDGVYEPSTSETYGVSYWLTTENMRWQLDSTVQAIARERRRSAQHDPARQTKRFKPHISLLQTNETQAKGVVPFNAEYEMPRLRTRLEMGGIKLPAYQPTAPLDFGHPQWLEAFEHQLFSYPANQLGGSDMVRALAIGTMSEHYLQGPRSTEPPRSPTFGATWMSN